jgi:hypothetical protein
LFAPEQEPPVRYARKAENQTSKTLNETATSTMSQRKDHNDQQDGANEALHSANSIDSRSIILSNSDSDLKFKPVFNDFDAPCSDNPDRINTNTPNVNDSQEDALVGDFLEKNESEDANVNQTTSLEDQKDTDRTNDNEGKRRSSRRRRIARDAAADDGTSLDANVKSVLQVEEATNTDAIENEKDNGKPQIVVASIVEEVEMAHLLCSLFA